MNLYGVYPPTADIQQAWQSQEAAWRFVARGVVIDDSYDPLAIKAIYVTGLIFHSCQAVQILLSPNNPTATMFYPAFAVFASAIELLGRCLTGNPSARNTGNDLAIGFRWLHRPNPVDFEDVAEGQVIVRTQNYAYTISDLIALRNFAAHGQALNLSEIRSFDYLVLGGFPVLLSRGIAEYLNALTTTELLASNLARASIAPFRNNPIFDIIWQFLSDANTFPAKVATAISRMDWTYKSPLANVY